MARPKKVNSEAQIDVDNGERKMKQIHQVVRVITRFPGKSDGVSIFEAEDVERYLASNYFADGWELFHVAFTGMEKYQETPDAGFRMLYVLTRG